MASPGVNAQAGALTMADVPDLRRFAPGGALAILDWPADAAALLAVLDAARVPVTMWRFCTDPTGWPGWPGDYLTRCPWALFGNEPDIEGWPAWYAEAAYAWYYAGGKVVDPACSDENQHDHDSGMAGVTSTVYTAVSAHVYPLGLGAANLAAVRARANGRPVFVTEFGVAGQQQTCLRQIAAMGIVEPVWLYTYRAKDAQAQPAYNVAGIALLPATAPQSRGNAPTAPDSPQGATMLKFLDLSRVNNVTDWSALAAAYDGVIIQTSYGGTSAEERGAEYWAAAKAHGLKRIAYHYLYPQYNTPEQEATNFLRNIAIDPGDGWAVDVEEPCPDPAAYSSAFMQIVEQGTGAPRNWYSYPAYIQQYGITAASVGNPHLWLASYRDTEPTPPPGWASISIWQHTSNATVAGIDGVVDEDYLYMDEAQYAALVKPAQGGTVDPITQLALNRAKAANPAIVPNADSMNFKAYREQIRVWDANGRPNYLDPGPWLRNEAATATDAYVPLDCGIVLHSTNKGGQWVTYLAEAKEHDAIFKACGWS